MENILDTLVEWLWGIPLLVTILFVGLYFTVCTKFFQFLYFGHIMKQTFGKLLKKDEAKGEGLLTPFQAVSTAIGGSVGVGNIGGVATAIAVGGPGSVFWMWCASLLGMIIKNVEVTLAVHYREKDEKENPYGGPTYYMEKALGEEKGIKLWIIPAFIFGMGIFSTLFITLQNYTISEAISGTFNLNMIAVSFVFLIINYYMIMGGISRLGKIASRMVPFMCVFYVFAGLFIVLKNADQLGTAFGLIFTSAFSGTAAVGGFTGSVVSKVIRMGVARAVFSNEAGNGTSPMIHSTAQTDHPVKQGIWGTFEVFVDTMVVCTITALVIIITGVWSSGMTGATLTLSGFETELGFTGRVIVTIGIFLFGVTTSSGWYSYYEIILRQAFRKNVDTKNKIVKAYQKIYALPGFIMVVFAVTIGLPGAYVWYFIDIASAIPTFINVLAILIMSPRYFELLKDYKARYMSIGVVDPAFKPFYEDRKKENIKNIG